MSAGVDYLLRQQGRLGSTSSDISSAERSSDVATSTHPIEPTYLVASSVARTKLREVADFRCSGDSDNVEFDLATLALYHGGSNVGGVIQMSQGTFYGVDWFSAQASYNNYWIRGVGLRSTIFKSKDAAEPFDRSAFVYMEGLSPKLSDVSVDLQHDGFLSAVGVFPDDDFGIVERVSVFVDPDVTETALRGGFWLGNEANIRDCLVEDFSEGTGIYCNGDNMSVTGCYVRHTTTQGTLSGDGIFVSSGSTSVRVIGNEILGTIAGAGIRVAGDNCIVMGNIVPDGILIDATADGTIVGGNIGTITDNGTNTVFLDNSTTTDFDTERWSAGVDVLAVKTGDYEIPMSGSYELIDVEARVKDQPTGSSIIVDLMKNGTTVFSTPGDRPTIATSTNEHTGIPNVTAGSDGDYLRVDIIQKDSNDVGQYLTVTIRFRRT
jgi:hypothetical protein